MLHLLLFLKYKCKQVFRDRPATPAIHARAARAHHVLLLPKTTSYFNVRCVWINYLTCDFHHFHVNRHHQFGWIVFFGLEVDEADADWKEPTWR